MFPLRDENPTLGNSLATFAIIGINAAAWIFVQGLGTDPALSMSVCEFGAIPGDLWDALAITGTSHIVVISGFNLSIVGGLFSALSVRLVGRRYAAWFASAAIVVYTLLVGASAAVVRAALMSLVAVWGQHIGRPYSAPNALFATALWMTAWNPSRSPRWASRISLRMTWMSGMVPVNVHLSK